jgi:hypothetical protein
MDDRTPPVGPSIRFAWERALLADDSVEGTQLLVLLALAVFIRRDDGCARPSQVTLAKATGLVDRTVRKHLARSVDGGWLELVARGGRHGSVGHASVYRARIPEPQSTAGLPTGTEQPDGRPTGTCMPPRPEVRPPSHSQPERPGHPSGTRVPTINDEQRGWPSEAPLRFLPDYVRAESGSR